MFGEFKPANDQIVSLRVRRLLIAEGDHADFRTPAPESDEPRLRYVRIRSDNTGMAPPTQCFLSYAHADVRGFDQLVANLKPYAFLHGIALWHDKGITAGSYWDDKIKQEIARSQIFILLTTNAFLGSEYVFKHELPAIMDQHKSANALVVPVIYRECAWRPFFGAYIQAVPVNDAGRLRPVHDWRDPETAMARATDAISAAILDWFGLAPPASPFASSLGKTP